MIAVATVVAGTDAEAETAALPSALAFLRLRQGRPGLLPTVAEAAAYPFTAQERAFVAQRWAAQAVGSAETVAQRLTDLAARTGVQELMVTTQSPELSTRLGTLDAVAAMVGQLPRGLAA